MSIGAKIVISFYCVLGTMVRNYKRKTPRIDAETLAKALAAVRAGESVHKAAKQFKLNFETLRTHVHRSAGEERRAVKHSKVSAVELRKAIEVVQAGSSIANAAATFGLNYQTLRMNIERQVASAPSGRVSDFSYASSNTFPSHDNCFSQIFDAEQEATLANYLLKASAMYYGLSTRSVRLLAFGFAKKSSIAAPKKWDEERMAGREWLLSFMKRHPELSLRGP